MNLTDVDDKIIKSASEREISIAAVTAPITEIFHADRAFLRIQDAELYPKATDHIPEMIAIVQRLVERNLAYKADDGTVYFAIDKFKGYGKLSRLDTREVKAGARVLQDDYSKENAQDFALWKAAKPEDEATGAAWDSPWGRGRPGWHLECSAMAMKYLGETLDIHCGGIDLIFPHHEDEIAQSEGATGKPFSRFWCHGEFLLTDGSKMAKRLGNVATVQDLRDKDVPAAAFRHFVFSTHYRKQLNLSGEALEASMEGVRRLGDFAGRLAAAKAATPELEKIAEDAEAEVLAALFDDLNAPIALGALFTFVRKANAELDRNGVDKRSLEKAREVFARINSVLDVVPEPVGPDPKLTEWVEERLNARKEARANRDFAKADSIRAEIEGRGIAIEDTPQGTKWKVR
jgi:cysteinyl-tRNA synthetase